MEGSDAEAVARRKFKNKTVKTVGNGLRPRTIAGLLNFMPFVFQPNQSRGLNATFHFKFTGAEEREATIAIKNRTIDIQEGLRRQADLRVTADAKTWLGFLAREKSLPLGFGEAKDPHQGRPASCFLPSANASRRRARVTSESRSCAGTIDAARPNRPRYRKNDPATGKIRWSGKLVLAETVDVDAQRQDLPFQVAGRGGSPVRITCPGNS